MKSRAGARERERQGEYVSGFKATIINYYDYVRELNSSSIHHFGENEKSKTFAQLPPVFDGITNTVYDMQAHTEISTHMQNFFHFHF